MRQHTDTSPRIDYTDEALTMSKNPCAEKSKRKNKIKEHQSAKRWAIRLIVANNAVQLMKVADATIGLYTLLPSRRRRADISDLY